MARKSPQLASYSLAATSYPNSSRRPTVVTPLLSGTGEFPLGPFATAAYSFRLPVSTNEYTELQTMKRGERLRHVFLKTTSFTEAATELGCWDQVDALKRSLDRDPTTGDVIPGYCGLRKVRIGLPGRGKRGGGRVIYYLIVGRTTILLLDLYAKNDQEDLSAQELQALVTLRNHIAGETRSGDIK